MLGVYTGKHDGNSVSACTGEAPRQLIGETREPVPAGRGEAARYGAWRKRNGACEIFMFPAPLKGRARQVKKLITAGPPALKKLPLLRVT
jgi:hypothetical protein